MKRMAYVIGGGRGGRGRGGFGDWRRRWWLIVEEEDV
jgi:hypothetical protein